MHQQLWCNWISLKPGLLYQPTNQPHNFTCKNRCQALPKSSHCKWQKSWQVSLGMRLGTAANSVLILAPCQSSVVVDQVLGGPSHHLVFAVTVYIDIMWLLITYSAFTLPSNLWLWSSSVIDGLGSHHTSEHADTSGSAITTFEHADQRESVTKSVMISLTCDKFLRP